MALDDNLITIEIILIIFTGIVGLFHKENRDEVLTWVLLSLAILNLVGLIALWAVLI